jgi:hypothetical protein
MANEGALANLNDSDAIDRLSNGTMLKQIAAEYGVSKVAVYKRLRKHPDYKDAIAAQAHAFVEQAMIEVNECDVDTVNIARARVDAAFKYAKAHNPDYADKHQVNHEVSVTGRVELGFANDLLSQVRTFENEAESVAETPMLQCDSEDNEQC